MEQKLKKIMANLFHINETEISENSSMETVRAWDSLKHMELVLSIEEEFKIPRLSMDEIVSMTNFVKIRDILRNKDVKI